MLRTLGQSFVAVAAVGLSSGAARATPAASPKAVAVAVPASRPEPAIATPGQAGDYLRRVHDRLHGRWTESFVKTVASTYAPTHALNSPSLETTVALTIRWDGTVAEVTTQRGSGVPEFDRAAMDVARKSAPYPLPPQDVVSDDSYAHLEWTFARDHRACAARPVVSRVDDPLDVSLPRLVQVNRIGEALRRVGDALKTGNEAGLDRFARLYLSRTMPDPVLTVSASVALAEAGDRTQTARLREALTARPTMELAVRGLRKLGVDICEATREPLTTGKAQTREVAVAAVRFAAREGVDIGGCLPALGTLASDGTQPGALRVSALDTILALAPASSRPVVMGLLEDKDPAVRGVAVLASVRRGAGRPEMYRLAPMLHHKAVEVRAAASAGMVRAGGDMALEQLYLLARETDARPAQGVALELAQMHSRASAEFLGKMLKRNNVAVQTAAAKALVARKDAGARAEVESAKSDDHLPRDVVAIVTGQAKPEKAAPVPVPVNSGGTIEPFRAMLNDSHNAEAAAWIVEKLPSLEPNDGIAVMGAWLVRGAAAKASAPAAKAAAPAAGAVAPVGATSPAAAPDQAPPADDAKPAPASAALNL